MKINQIQHSCTVNQDFYYDRPHGLNEYVLILSHGEAYFHSNGNRYLLKPNELFLYDKLQPQLFYSAGSDFCHDWFHFDMDESDLAFFNSLDVPFGEPIFISNPYLLSELIKIMASEHYFQAPHRIDVINTLMSCFFMKLSDMIHAPKELNHEHPHYQSLCTIRNELYSLPYYEWSLDVISSRANLSKSWLQHNWKAIFGVSYQIDLITSRIRYAQNLLCHTNYTVDRIAEASGYNSTIHFIRQFKQVTNLTPTAYRKQFPQLIDTPKEFEQKLIIGTKRSSSKHKPPKTIF